MKCSFSHWRNAMLWILLSTGGCGWEKQVAVLSARIEELEKTNHLTKLNLFERMIQLEAQHDQDNRKVWSRFNCKERNVYEFLKQCEGGESATCTESSMAAALSFMDSQPFSVIYLRPEIGIRGLHPVRKGQLLQLSDMRSQTQSTRYLILVQPRGETPEDQAEALAGGRELLKYLRTDINLPKLVQVIGPTLLPCKLKMEQLKHYGRRVDLAQIGEPQANEPRLRLWVFRTDC